jgi:hypothetical protein
MKNLVLWLARLFTIGFIGLSASVALALPSPADIDKAVGAGQYSQAESMLREVIAEKPQSAKAHYQLAQVLDRQSRYADAKKELVRAREIDPTLKFAASSERFNELFDKTSAAAAGAGSTRSGGVVSSGLQAPPPATVSAVPASSGASASGSQGISMNNILIGVGILGLLALVLWRVSQSSQRQAPTAFGMTPAPAGGAARPARARVLRRASSRRPCVRNQRGVSGPHHAPASRKAVGASDRKLSSWARACSLLIRA